MIIKQITIKNFRQYKGELEPITFSTDKDKNVTVILGVNSAGKSTIVQAFKWCLYNETNFDDRDLLNEEVGYALSIGSSTEVAVEIELVHDDILYVIRRSEAYSKNASGNLKLEHNRLKVQYKEDNGEMQEIPSFDAQDTINKILPYNLSNYFFFAGEDIKNMNNKKDVAQAIKGLMGIDVIGEAVKHLNPASSSSVISKLRKGLDVGHNEKNIVLQSRITLGKRQLETLEGEIAKIKDEIEFFEDREEELESRIRENEGTKQKQIEKDEYKKQIETFRSRIPDKEKRLVHDFSKNTYRYFALPLYAKAIKVLDDTKSDGEGIPEMHAIAIDYILNRKKCICGCDLSNNQGAVDRIKYERSLLPPENIGTTVRKYKETCEQYKHEVEDFADNIEQDYKELRENHKYMSIAQEKFDKLSGELVNNEDIGRLEADNVKNAEELKNARRRLNVKTEELGGLKNLIFDSEREIDALVASSEKNKKIKKNIDYAVELFNWFNANYEEKEQAVRHDLYESINKWFNSIYHGERIVELNNDYRINLKVKIADGVYKTLNNSDGTKMVKNFAFIAGLVDLAKRRAQEEQEEGSLVEPYPIVMDAPFSDVDREHIVNTVKVFPNVAEQVIFIVMEKDWDCAKNAMEDKISKIYEIEKFSETNSTIRRVK